MTIETAGALLSPMNGPIQRTEIPYHVPYYGKAARERLLACLEARSLHGGGSTAEAVQQRLGDLLGVETLLLTPSCTAAMEVAVRAAGFGPGDEVIVPAFTFVSSASAATAFGARPVFVDISSSDLCQNLDRVAAAITPRTRGIVAVHYAGQAADMAALRALCDEHGLILIEDAAHALFCTQNERYLGSFGHFAAFSFHDSKVFSAGEGGALIVNDPAFRDSTYTVREKGTNRRAFLDRKVDKYGWIAQGTSAFMGGLSAALLDAQLDEKDWILERRAAIHQLYSEVIGPVADKAGVERIQVRPGERLSHHIYWLNFATPADRIEIQRNLQTSGILATPQYPALHLSEYCQRMNWTPPHDLPVAERTADCLLRMPLYTEMTEDDVRIVAETAAEQLASLVG